MLRSLCSFLFHRRWMVGVFVFFIWAGSFSPAAAISYSEWTVTPHINYQAKLLDSNGAPVTDGSHSIKFSLYDAATAGTRLWTAKGTTSVPTAMSLSISGGLFTVRLGDSSSEGGTQNPFDENIDWNSPNLYLGVTVGSDSEMLPRKRLTSVAQAFNAQMLQGMSASGTAFGSASVFTIHQTSASFATGTRSALKIVSQGMSELGDYLITTSNSSGTNAFNVSRTGRITTLGGMSAVASSSGPVVIVSNTGEADLGQAWGIGTNRLLVGADLSATGTANYRMVLNYVSDGGICLDNTASPETCPSPGAGESLVSDGTINTTPFDLAERYEITGEAEPGDLLVMDPASPLHLARSPGVVYDPRLIGIVSTEPGFLLGRGGDVSLALAGRVPTKVSMQNGPIAIGDPLTSSPYPGRAMKATQPGRIVGYALEAASATGTIEVFVEAGFHAGTFLRTNGNETLATNHLIFNAQSEASVAQSTVDSWGLTFRGSAWDGSSALNQDLTLFQDVLTSTSSALSLKSGTSTVWSVDQGGSVRMSGDLFVGGKIFPATRNGIQNEKYLFLDDQMGATSTYIATNADGWQANDSYDFAERYYSPDALQPGDLVVISQRGRLHVQRSLDEKHMLLGIVSTKPAFVAGAPGPSTYPIALAGRVPTNVSAAKGKIAIGDLLAPSTMPGVAVKAVQAGPVVGQALEAFDGTGTGSIEVFVNPTWWSGPEKPTVELGNGSVGQVIVERDRVSYRGLARILAGGQRVHITFPALNSYPMVQVTPQGNVGEGWWTDNYTHDGFDIILKSVLVQPVTFNWRVEPTDMTDNRMFLSNGEIAPFDPRTGLIPALPEGEQRETIREVTNDPPPAPTENTDEEPDPVPPPSDNSEDEVTSEETQEPATEEESSDAPTEPIETSIETETVTSPVSETVSSELPASTEPLPNAVPSEATDPAPVSESGPSVSVPASSEESTP